MEENSQNEQQNTEEVKKATINQTKENLNNTKSSAGSSIAEGFKTLFTNPFDLIEKSANGPKNYFLLFAVILLVVWVSTTLIGSIISTVLAFLDVSIYLREGFWAIARILSVFGDLLAPVVTVAVLSLLIFLFKKGEKKSFITIAISVIIAYAPVVVSSIINLLGVFTTSVTGGFTSMFALFCLIVTSVLMFFTIKSLYKQENNNVVFRKYLIIMGIFYGAQFIFNTAIQFIYNLLTNVF